MIFKKDSIFIGLCVGLLVPLLFYFLQRVLIPVLFGHSFSEASIQLFALVLNIPFLRYYLINLRYENAGKGVLFATFVYAFIWVYINQLGI